jgi:hypothetical protein
MWFEPDTAATRKVYGDFLSSELKLQRMTFVLPKRYSARATPERMDFESFLGRSQGLCQVRKGLVPSDASHPLRSPYGDACRLEDILTMLLLDGLATRRFRKSC